eukprot:939923-Karenia_brevis.AAC.1
MQDVPLDATNTKANALHVYSGDQGHHRCNSLIQLFQGRIEAQVKWHEIHPIQKQSLLLAVFFIPKIA